MELTMVLAVYASVLYPKCDSVNQNVTVAVRNGFRSTSGLADIQKLDLR